MKNLVLNFILIFFISFAFSQNDCNHTVFYEISLKKTLSNDRCYDVNFYYKLSDSLKKFLLKSNILKEDERDIVEHELLESKFTPCNSLKEKIQELKDRSLDKNDRYRFINYTKPIFVSDSKVLLFGEALIMTKNHRGSRGGASFMEIFKKTDDKWSFVERKILEVY